MEAFSQRPPRSRDDRLAEIFDDEVYPLFARRFARMLVSALEPKPGIAVLEVGCRAGAVASDLLHKIDGDSRIVALDPSPAFLDRARARIGRDHAGRRVFFRQHDLGKKLPFDEGAFDAVVANVMLPEVDDPSAAINDFVRVLKPGGQLVVTTPLRGTWAELLDILSEVLARSQRTEARSALAAHVVAQPEGETVALMLEAAGILEVEEELDRWELLFKSAREFFYAPVIEHGPLPRWKAIAGSGAEMHQVFFELKEAIDTYFTGHTFAVGVFGGCFSGRKA